MKKVFACLGTLGIIFILFSSCATVPDEKSPYTQEGIASWYGPGFHGKTTSNKEIYNMNDMTAAHRTLPFGTYVMVTNLNNAKTVTVRINDRGPFVKDRIIDLSYAAAQVIDMIDAGTAPVRIEVLAELSPPLDSQKFSIQLGSFTRRDNALALEGKLEKQYPNVYVSEFKTAQRTYYRVRIKVANHEEAQALARKLEEAGFTVLILEEQ